MGLCQDILSPEGVFYLVAVERNGPQKILRTMDERGIRGEVCSFSIKLTEIILKRNAGGEILYVLRFTH